MCAGRQRYPVVVVSFEISSELSIGCFSHAVRWMQFLQVVQALILSETTLVVFRQTKMNEGFTTGCRLAGSYGLPFLKREEYDGWLVF